MKHRQTYTEAGRNARPRRCAYVGLAGIACLLAAAPAAAIINPDYTPRHLCERSEVIATGAVARGSADGTWKLAKQGALKGKADAEYVFSMEQCNPDQAPQVKELLAANQDLVLFSGSMEGAARIYLHTGGTWLDGDRGADGKSWQIRGFAPALDGTYAGGSDQLARMMEYLTKEPDASVPVSANVRWLGDPIRVGKAPGPVSGLAGIQLGRAGKWHVFCASPAGDSLFLAETSDGETVFKDVTTTSGVKTKSTFFAWCDLNGDGLADLVSSDGKTVTVCFGKVDGTLATAGGAWALALEDGCIGLTPCGIGAAPGVLVTGRNGPLLLLAQGRNGWRRLELPRGNQPAMAGALVADFDGDGYADVLVPGEAGGLLWKGGSEGFAKPVACPLGTGGGRAWFAMGDFNQDGALDVFVAGTSRNSLWENDGKGNFRDVFHFSGAPSYKCPTGATAARVMDLNQDGCPDLCLAYSPGSIVYYFNRGFRALANENEVRLPGLPPNGVAALATGDFDANSSMDLVVATAGNEIVCFLNEMYSRPGVLLRLPAGTAAPVTVSAWQGETCPVACGVVVATDAVGTYVPARDAGNLTLKWTAPGKGPQTKSIIVENKTTVVTLP